MKHILIAVAAISMSMPLVVHAEEKKEPVAKAETPEVAESTTSTLTDLCNAYAQEDDIAESAKAIYVSKCLERMTDLSETIQETVPLVADVTEEPVAAPTSEVVNSDPEQLVKGELVETPDPSAEQLSAEKK
jgi:hypothetical protein